MNIPSMPVKENENKHEEEDPVISCPSSDDDHSVVDATEAVDKSASEGEWDKLSEEGATTPEEKSVKDVNDEDSDLDERMSTPDEDEEEEHIDVVESDDDRESESEDEEKSTEDDSSEERQLAEIIDVSGQPISSDSEDEENSDHVDVEDDSDSDEEVGEDLVTRIALSDYKEVRDEVEESTESDSDQEDSDEEESEDEDSHEAESGEEMSDVDEEDEEEDSEEEDSDEEESGEDESEDEYVSSLEKKNMELERMIKSLREERNKDKAQIKNKDREIQKLTRNNGFLANQMFRRVHADFNAINNLKSEEFTPSDPKEFMVEFERELEYKSRDHMIEEEEDDEGAKPALYSDVMNLRNMTQYWNGRGLNNAIKKAGFKKARCPHCDQFLHTPSELIVHFAGIKHYKKNSPSVRVINYFTHLITQFQSRDRMAAGGEPRRYH